MADGTYERRGPREAELKRFQRLLDERAAARAKASRESADKSAETPKSAQ